jgi:ATP-dependent Lon protease
VLATKLRHRVANPMFVVDEVEKALSNSEHASLWDVLLTVPGFESASSFLDSSVGAQADLSAALCLATAERAVRAKLLDDATRLPMGFRGSA